MAAKKRFPSRIKSRRPKRTKSTSDPLSLSDRSPRIKRPSAFEHDTKVSTLYQHLQARLERTCESFNAAQNQWQMKITQTASHTAETAAALQRTTVDLGTVAKQLADFIAGMDMAVSHLEQRYYALLDRLNLLEAEPVRQVLPTAPWLQGLQHPGAGFLPLWSAEGLEMLADNVRKDIKAARHEDIDYDFTDEQAFTESMVRQRASSDD